MGENCHKRSLKECYSSEGQSLSLYEDSIQSKPAGLLSMTPEIFLFYFVINRSNDLHSRKQTKLLFVFEKSYCMKIKTMEANQTLGKISIRIFLFIFYEFVSLQIT